MVRGKSNTSEERFVFPIYEMRLHPKDVSKGDEIYKYNGKEWLPNTRGWGMAFINRSTTMVYYVNLPYHINIKWSWVTTHWSQNVAAHPKQNAWHYTLKDGEDSFGDGWLRELHPNTRAGKLGMDKLCSMNGCANGTGPEFHPQNRWIKKGFLRNKETKKIVSVPKEFICMYGCKATLDAVLDH